MDIYGNTELMHACQMMDAEKASFLVTNGYISDASNYLEESEIIVACRYQLDDIALQLVKLGHAKKDKTDSYRYTELMTACENFCVKTAAALIDLKHFSSEDRDIRDTSVLSIAIDARLDFISQSLVEEGVGRDVKSKGGLSYFMHACQRHLPLTAMALIRHKRLNKELQCKKGMTELMYAITGLENEDVSLALIALGQYNLSLSDNSGETELMIAKRLRKSKVVRALIDTVI